MIFKSYEKRRRAGLHASYAARDQIYQTIKKHASLIELASQDQRAGWPCLSACGFFFNVNERINPISAKTAATIKAEFMP